MEESINFRIECNIINSAVDLEENKLPTIKEVLQCYEYIKLKKLLVCKFDPAIKDIVDEILVKLKRIWGKINVPIITDSGIIKLIKTNMKDLKALRKRIQTNLKGKQVLEDSAKFKNEIEGLLDLSKCKCELFESCICPND